MDWKKLMAELSAGGLTQVQIASECGVAQATISALARGATESPSFALGTKLTALHELRGKPVEAARAA